MYRHSRSIAAVVFTAGVAAVVGQAAGAVPGRGGVCDRQLAPERRPAAEKALGKLIEQGVSAETIAKAMGADGIPVETTIRMLRAMEVPPGAVIKSLHAAVTTRPPRHRSTRC